MVILDVRPITRNILELLVSSVSLQCNQTIEEWLLERSLMGKLSSNLHDYPQDKDLLDVCVSVCVYLPINLYVFVEVEHVCGMQCKYI